MKLRSAAVLLALAALGLPLRGAELSVEWITSPEADSITRLPRHAWAADGTILLLDDRRPPAERAFERIDPVSGARRPAVDRAAALSSLQAVAGSEAPDALAWPLSLDRAARLALYDFGGDLFLLELDRSRFERLMRTPERETNGRLSPDGKSVAFVRNNDLYVLDRASRAERRLTTDGGPAILNGILSFVYWEEIFHRDDDGFWWSDDSQAIAFLRSDESDVDVATFTSFEPAVPRVITQRYPRVGRPNPVVRLGIVDLSSGRTRWMDAPAPGYEYIIGLEWRPDSRALAVQTTNRAQDRLDLLLFERESGSTRRLLTDLDAAWVNQKEIEFLADGRELLVSSERDGWTHLYRYRSDGTLAGRVTRGPWSVRGPSAFYAAPLGSAFADEAGSFVYFTAMEKSPIERHLYRVRLDGSGMTRLTREDGVHRITFSPNRRFYLDAHSSHAVPPSLTLHAADGSLRGVVAPARVDLLEPFRLPSYTLFTVPAADGFPLHARILKPRGFDAFVRHPVVFRIYGGTGVPLVEDEWDRAALFDQLLAQRGYVVFSIDNRTATAASKTIENIALYDEWGESALKDLLDGVRWVEAQTWADPERLGVWGRSGGGYFTLAAMTKSSRFKAGVSIAPVTDWRYYDTKSTEAYMRTPAENLKGYEETNLVARAKDLHGRLLLVWGTYDDNVHPQNSLAFIDALIAAGKPFDMMAYPMRKHGIDDRAARAHLFEKMLEFWKRYL